jgi:hypothetical protein
MEMWQLIKIENVVVNPDRWSGSTANADNVVATNMRVALGSEMLILRPAELGISIDARQKICLYQTGCVFNVRG